MSVSTRPAPAGPAAAPPAGRPPAAPPAPPRARLPWLPALVTAPAVLAAGAPVGAIVRGTDWLAHGAAAVALVVALGLLLHRAGPALVALGQCVGVLLLATWWFTGSALPGPGAFGRFAGLVSGAGAQIAVGVAPVAATPEILFLVTTAFGLVTVGTYLAAVPAQAPAAAGVPLLAVFAVPAALADDLLPWWTLVSAASGFGLLLLSRARPRGLPGGAAVVAGAVVVALGVGAVTGFVGTGGRFTGSGGGSAGAIGLSPFTALRGQLSMSTPRELFRVRGLAQPTYLRALTLRDYVPNTGWQATRPDQGPPLPGAVAPDPGPAGQVASVEVENVGFRDYWLPLYGDPVAVTGLPGGTWTYDAHSGTAYATRPRQDDGWQERAALAVPTADQLRASGTGSPGGGYLDLAGVDPRVIDLARQVTAGRTNGFDRAIALQDFFTGPGSRFTYSLQTAQGNGDDALVEFLTVGRTGYCEQFSAAMAVMLRAVGVPARVAVGFTGGTEKGGYRSITTADAHAWVEAYFAGHGWITFDPTPLTDGRTITPPYVAEAQVQEAGTDRNGADAGTQPDQLKPSPPPPAPVPDAAMPQQQPAPAPGSGVPWWPFVLGGVLLVAAGAVLLPGLLRRRDRARRLAAAARGGSGAAGAAWDEVLAESVDRGVAPRPSETVRGTARRLARAHDLDGEGRRGLRELVGAVEASWYGGDDPGPGALDGAVSAVRGAIATARPLSMRERLLPRSVIERARLRRRRPANDGPAHDDAAAPVGRGGGVDGATREAATPARTGGGSAPPSAR